VCLSRHMFAPILTISPRSPPSWVPTCAFAPTQRPSPIIATLTYGTVRLIDYDYLVQRPWTRVKLSDGRTGYVNGQYLRASSDFCAYFARRNGTWRMTVFIQPDYARRASSDRQPRGVANCDEKGTLRHWRLSALRPPVPED
jgi:hypothetical protein